MCCHGNMIMTCSWDKLMVLYHVENDNPIHVFEGHSEGQYQGYWKLYNLILWSVKNLVVWLHCIIQRLTTDIFGRTVYSSTSQRKQWQFWMWRSWKGITVNDSSHQNWSVDALDELTLLYTHCENDSVFYGQGITIFTSFYATNTVFFH